MYTVCGTVTTGEDGRLVYNPDGNKKTIQFGTLNNPEVLPMTELFMRDARMRGRLFQEPDSTLLLSGGMARHWPDARGMWMNEEANLFTWSNEEDHV